MSPVIPHCSGDADLDAMGVAPNECGPPLAAALAPLDATRIRLRCDLGDGCGGLGFYDPSVLLSLVSTA